MDVEKAKSKITKLLALGADGSGATEHERERALAQANKLCMIYNLSLGELEIPSHAIDMVHTVIEVGDRVYNRQIAHAIARLYFCEFLIFKGTKKGVVIGRKANVETTSIIIMYVTDGMNKEARMAYPNLVASRNDFCLGVASGIHEQCANLRTKNEAMPHGNGKELVVVNLYQQRQLENNEYVSENFGAVGSEKNTGKKNINSNAYFTGKAHGLATQLTVDLN